MNNQLAFLRALFGGMPAGQLLAIDKGPTKKLPKERKTPKKRFPVNSAQQN